MTDGQAAEPPQGSPSRRALGAMESAARRAREGAGGAPLLPAPPQRRTSEPAPPERKHVQSWQPDHWLMVAVAAVALLVVGAALALVVSLASGNGPQSTATAPSTVTTPNHGGGARPAHHPPTTGSSGPSNASTTTSTPAPAAEGGAPVISALSPSTGVAGQGIEVSGSNFLSSNGQIVATFDGQVAPTRCPSQNTCAVTVPTSTGSPSAQVTITTAAGTSNAVTFTYG